MPHNCDTCTHWHAKTAAARAEAFSVGECRCNPPPRDYAWPRTKAADTCSQHSSLVTFATARGKKSNSAK